MAAQTPDGAWFPDLCRLPRLLAMLGLAELAVMVVWLVPNGMRDWSATAFASASGYALWLGLSISVLLCVSRRWLSSLPIVSGAVLALAISSIVAAAVATIVHGLFIGVDAGREWPSAWRFTWGSAAVAGLLTGLALRYFYAVDRWQAQVRAKARAEIEALQARIRPHFLFNSMNTIAGLVRVDPEVAERAVLDLSDLFRAALGADQSDSTLRQEVDLAERYLAIEQLRLGERLKVAWHTREPLPWAMTMPRLVLQPILENAVLHGISRLQQGGVIDITLRIDQGGLVIRVANPSLAPKPGDPQGAGHALRNVGLRLSYAFGPSVRMSSGWNDDSYVSEMRLPLDDLDARQSVADGPGGPARGTPHARPANPTAHPVEGQAWPPRG